MHISFTGYFAGSGRPTLAGYGPCSPTRFPNDSWSLKLMQAGQGYRRLAQGILHTVPFPLSYPQRLQR